MEIKIGYHAPCGHRLDYGFGSIAVPDMHYCESHDFWYNIDEQEKLLHFGQPCIYTDQSFKLSRHNFFREGHLYNNRRKPISLASAKRRIRKTRNIPVGTVVKIWHRMYGIHKKRKNGKISTYSLGYGYKVTKENKFEPQYQVTEPSYLRNFESDEKAKNLTDLLRANGFLVSVWREEADDSYGIHIDDMGEQAVAYGHGLIVGYSSQDNLYRGYTYGIKSILFEWGENFNKWSQCFELGKELPNEEILAELLKGAKEMALREDL